MASDVWFTSDLHLDHKAINGYGRAFSSVDEMNEVLIQKWNEAVKPGDRIYFLGDFSLGDVQRATEFVARMHGQKFMIFGNHDKALRKHAPFLAHFEWARELDRVKIFEQQIVMCHYAMLTFDQMHRGAWQLHGHSHGNLPDDPNALRTDVGVDRWDMRPVGFETIRALMATRTFKPVDHHGRA